MGQDTLVANDVSGLALRIVRSVLDRHRRLGFFLVGVPVFERFRPPAGNR